MALLAGLGLMLSTGLVPRPVRVLEAAGPRAFNLLDWELVQLAQRADRIAGALLRPPRLEGDERRAMGEFFSTPPAARADVRPDAEAALERQLATLLRDEGLTVGLVGGVETVFPPVSFRFTTPPALLVISPRDRMTVVQSVFLDAGLTAGEVRSLEERAEREGVSALVTPIGGLATYPAMVVESGRAGDVLSAVAHEWLHAYLAFRPLGQRYWSSQEMRTVNETVAELAGRELGGQLAEMNGLPPPASPGAGPGDPRFRQEMRRTRLEVERLLASGEIAEAEGYMEQRRQELAGVGYRIRRLNQAYFAFHGSYGESAAGDGRIAGLVRAARGSSGSIGEFVRRMAGVESIGDLEAVAAGREAEHADAGRTEDGADTG